MTDQTQHSPHWADKLANSILKWQEKKAIKKLHCDDMKTPSGRVHTGSLRGAVLHDLVAQVLAQKTEQEITSTFVINDMDPMDGLPSYLNEKEYAQHMGKPLHQIPAPPLNKSGINFKNANQQEKAKYQNAKSFGEFYALDFIDAFRQVGCVQKIVWSHELYESGQMDEAIRLALDNVDKLKKIYQNIADYQLPENWYPFQVICPKCGKVGTTLTTAWDGKQVSFECQKNKVDWAKGCGYQGKISPFGGTGKLLWKVDWPAHWKTMGVTVEGAGKDHCSAGGSRDMANAICEQIYDIELFDIPYEWILIRGAKMSSSKGVGTSAREFVNLFPKEIGRFLFVNKHYNQAIDFDPRTETIPDMYDEYDLGAKIYWGQEKGDQRLARSFELSQTDQIPEPCFLPRFRDISTWMQHSEIDLEAKFAEIKKSKLTKQEIEILKSRQKYAQIWVNIYAPEAYRLTPSLDLPEQALVLNSEQLNYLDQAIKLTKSQPWQEPQELQQALFDLSKKSIGARQAFQSIYLAFIGKTHGPRAAWFLLNISDEILNTRIEQIKQAQAKQKSKKYLFKNLDQPNLFSIDKDFAKKYPSAIIGLAVIKNVDIKKLDQELEKEKASFLDNIKDLTPKEVQENLEIASYKKLYQNMGVNWAERKASPAALLIRAAQGKGVAQINTCVDAYNLIVMKNRVSAGAFDLDQFKFPVVLKMAQGGEKIKIIGEDEPVVLQKGEVCYFDKLGAYNMDYNFRDAVRTQVTEKTKNLLINVEGIYDISREQVEKSLQEVINIIQKYCGGKVEVAGVVEAK